MVLGQRSSSSLGGGASVFGSAIGLWHSSRAAGDRRKVMILFKFELEVFNSALGALVVGSEDLGVGWRRFALVSYFLRYFVLC